MNASMHVYTSYMGGVATRIPGAGQSACEGCPPAAMTRPMQTCTQGHRSRAQTVKALRQSMIDSSTSVIGKAISSSSPKLDPDFESDSPEGHCQCQPWSSETFIPRILQQDWIQDALYSRQVCAKTSIQSSIHPREPTWQIKKDKFLPITSQILHHYSGKKYVVIETGSNGSNW